MEGKFPLKQGHGHWRIQERGEEIWVHMEGKDDARGLYKGYLEGIGGKYMLGTLVPEGGKLVLKRRLLRTDLERQGIWPVHCGGMLLAFETPKVAHSIPRQSLPLGWRRENCPECLLRDRLLSRCAQGKRGALVRRRGQGFQMAFPFTPMEAFAMDPLFCFAQIQEIEGKWYALFSFTEEGCPILNLESE